MTYILAQPRKGERLPLTDDERIMADENKGDEACAVARPGLMYQCCRLRGHAGRHVAIGGGFLGAWGTKVSDAT